MIAAGTIIWTAPTGDKYITHPGSALIFPNLCAPTGPSTGKHSHQNPTTHRGHELPRV